MAISRAISNDDWASLRAAAESLEHPSLAARLTSVLGTPIEEGFKLLPKKGYERVHDAVESVMHKTLNVAISTIPGDSSTPREGENRNLGILTGAAGGFFGLPGLLVELPFTTMLMLRSIAAIASSEGEDLDTLDSRVSCVEVFAFGGPSKSDDAAETGYYGLRMMLAYHFSMASESLVSKGLATAQLPALVGLVRAVAARFGIAVSEKAAFQMVPLFGAAGGAIVNAIFMDHFQRIARGHFVVRRLEREYGEDTIRLAYEKVAEAA
jgi:hypothetical protein